MQELIEVMHKVHLVENPCLFKLIDDPFEEASCHLNQISVVTKGAELVDHGHITIDHIVIYEK